MLHAALTLLTVNNISIIIRTSMIVSTIMMMMMMMIFMIVIIVIIIITIRIDINIYIYTHMSINIEPRKILLGRGLRQQPSLPPFKSYLNPS